MDMFIIMIGVYLLGVGTGLQSADIFHKWIKFKLNEIKQARRRQTIFDKDGK